MPNKLFKYLVVGKSGNRNRVLRLLKEFIPESEQTQIYETEPDLLLLLQQIKELCIGSQRNIDRLFLLYACDHMDRHKHQTYIDVIRTAGKTGVGRMDIYGYKILYHILLPERGTEASTRESKYLICDNTAVSLKRYIYLLSKHHFMTINCDAGIIKQYEEFCKCESLAETFESTLELLSNSQFSLHIDEVLIQCESLDDERLVNFFQALKPGKRKLYDTSFIIVTDKEGDAKEFRKPGRTVRTTTPNSLQDLFKKIRREGAQNLFNNLGYG